MISKCGLLCGKRRCRDCEETRWTGTGSNEWWICRVCIAQCMNRCSHMHEQFADLQCGGGESILLHTNNPAQYIPQEVLISSRLTKTESRTVKLDQVLSLTQ